MLYSMSSLCSGDLHPKQERISRLLCTAHGHIWCLVMVVVWMISLVFVPETPAHYISLKNYRGARESLEWLRGTIHVEQEYEEILNSSEESANLSAGIGDLFKR